MRFSAFHIFSSVGVNITTEVRKFAMHLVKIAYLVSSVYSYNFHYIEDLLLEQFRVINHASEQANSTGIESYGCWCHFDENRRLAKGPIQDEFDAACKKLPNFFYLVNRLV